MRDASASSSAWKRLGSSVVWDPRLWGSLLEAAPPIPLREALRWANGDFPAHPPHEGPLLIVGLQTCVEVLEERAAFHFLRSQINRLVGRAQDRWPNTALVFGMSAAAKDWQIDAQDHAKLRVRAGHDVDFTFGLWSGMAREAYRLMIPAEASRQPDVCGGFYLARLS